MEKESELLSLLNDEDTRDVGFKMLMNMYQERLYWHIRRMTHIHEDADDVLQNTLIKVFRNISSFNGKSKLYTWLYRIATNECITFLKKKKKGNTESLEGENESMTRELIADPHWEGDQTQLILQKALFTLPEKQKAVFNLRYYDEMPYREMSEILETSEGSLKASYHHAVKKIETYIKEHIEDYS